MTLRGGLAILTTGGRTEEREQNFLYTGITTVTIMYLCVRA